MGRTPKIMKQFYTANNEFSMFSSTNILLASLQDVDVDKLDMMYRDPDIEQFVTMRAQWMALMVNAYRHPNKEIEAFVEDALKEIEGGLNNVLVDAFADNIVYGHHVSEIVYTAKGDKIVPKRFVYIPVQDRVLLSNKNGDLAGVMLYNGVELKPEKVFYYNMRPNRGLLGKSKIASLYPYYLLLKTSLFNYGRVLERFGIPWAVGKSMDTESMLELLKNLYSIASAAIDPEEDIQVIETRDTGEAFERAINIVLRAFIRHLGIPELMVNVQQTGTYNLGAVQYTAFLDEVESLARKQNVPLVKSLIKNILDINFGEQEDYGEFVVIKDPNVESMKGYAAVLQMMNQAQALNDNIKQWVYERMGIPEDKMGLEVNKGEVGDQNKS